VPVEFVKQLLMARADDSHHLIAFKPGQFRA
jgi:hypothetical protein